jgi:hypothetical protein
MIFPLILCSLSVPKYNGGITHPPTLLQTALQISYETNASTPKGKWRSCHSREPNGKKTKENLMVKKQFLNF